jgi:hypothetical protein
LVVGEQLDSDYSDGRRHLFFLLGQLFLPRERRLLIFRGRGGDVCERMGEGWWIGFLMYYFLFSMANSLLLCSSCYRSLLAESVLFHLVPRLEVVLLNLVRINFRLPLPPNESPNLPQPTSSHCPSARQPTRRHHRTETGPYISFSVFTTMLPGSQRLSQPYFCLCREFCRRKMGSLVAFTL